MGDRRSAQGDQCSCRAHPLVWRFPFGVRRSAASALALRSAGRSAPMADELIAWLDWAPAYEREHGRRHGEAERLETRVAFPARLCCQSGKLFDCFRCMKAGEFAQLLLRLMENI